MRVLYEADITGDSAGEIVELAFGRFRFTEDGRRYAEMLVHECVRHRRKIDNALRRQLENWELERLAAVERAILRMATAEILYVPETPVQVILDEALHLAHRYGADGAAGLVNGVLDPIARSQRPSEVKPREDLQG
jgi:N utilization substance protein B